LVALFSSAFRVIAAQQKFPNFSFDCWVDSLFAHPKIKTIPWQNESKESHDIVTILGIKKEHILAVKAIIGTHHIEKSSLRRTRRNVEDYITTHGVTSWKGHRILVSPFYGSILFLLN